MKSVIITLAILGAMAVGFAIAVWLGLMAFVWIVRKFKK